MSIVRLCGGFTVLLAVAGLGFIAPASAFEPAKPGVPASAGVTSVGPSTVALDEALQTLKASHAVWRENDADFRRQRAGQKLSETESDEFATYVAGLRLQVLKDCQEVRRSGGERYLAKYDCGAGGRASAGGAQAGGSPGEDTVAALPAPETARTESETVGSIEDALRRIESDLDELTRRKTEEARAAGASDGVPGDGAGRGDDRGGASGGNAKDSAWQPPPPTGAATDGDAEKDSDDTDKKVAKGGAEDPTDPDTQNGQKQSSDRGATADEKDTSRKTAKVDETPGREGTDDDVLARQLREAAEKEQDPVLREKLWSEYRKYKESQR